MVDQMESPEHGQLLRRRAEEALQGKPVDVDDLSGLDIQYLLHELQVHQAELEIQNAELQRAQLELEESRDQYASLYHFAPAGYCTLNARGIILEANQALGHMLDAKPEDLLQQPLSNFVVYDDQDRFYLYRSRAFDGQKPPQPVELRMQPPTGKLIYVRLQSLLTGEEEKRLLLMLIDITRQRELQNRLIEQREKERQKIAHDLHDGPVQELAAISFELKTIMLDLPEGELTEAMEAIQASLRAQIQVLRAHSVQLRPPILTHMGLEMAIQSFALHFHERYPDLDLKLSLQPVGDILPEVVTVALFRICQEALQNAAKHAGGSGNTIWVRLSVNNRFVRLEVEDNGPGFTLPEDWYALVQAGHLGLVGMRERAEAVGGQLEVRAVPGQGTLVRALAPLQLAKL